MTTLIAICGQPLVHALGWTLLHLCWQGTLVAVGLWCVLEALGGRSSQVRYGVSCLALGLMIALPLATFAHLASVEYQLRAAFDSSAVAIEPGMVVRVGARELSAPWPERIAVALDARAAVDDDGVVRGRGPVCCAAKCGADGCAQDEVRRYNGCAR